MVALAQGTMMRKRMVKSPAPSRRADSSRLCGMARKEVRITIMFQVLITPGRMTAIRVLYNPTPLTTRNLGIMPPEKYMVNTTSSVNSFLNISLGRDSVYAPRQEKKMLSTVPTTT